MMKNLATSVCAARKAAPGKGSSVGWIAALLGAALLLGGCGQKGPLSLPAPKAVAPAASVPAH